jgi:hypothetical protein
VGRTSRCCLRPPTRLRARLTRHSRPSLPLPARSEWATQHHRDTFASILGHYDMLSYVALAENSAVGRVKFTMLEKMLSPCGPPPATSGGIVLPAAAAAAAAAAAGTAGGAPAAARGDDMKD